MPLPTFNYRFNPFTGVFYPADLTEEHTVQYHVEFNAYGIILDEVPQQNSPSTTGIAGYTEVPRLTPPSSGQFRVDYQALNHYGMAFVEFNASENGEVVTVEYKGLGSTVKGEYQLNQLTRVNENLEVGETLTVEGESEFQAGVVVSGSLTVEGSGNNVIIENDLSIGGGIESDSLGITGNAVVVGSITAGGAISGDNGLDITLGGASIAGGVDITGDLAVSGGMTLGDIDNADTSLVSALVRAAVRHPFLSIARAEANQYQGVAYGNGVFVAVSSDGTNRVARSADYGLTWTTIFVTTSYAYKCVAASPFGMFVAVASNRAMYSFGGVSFSSVAIPETNSWSAVAYGNGYFVAVASDGTNRVMRTSNFVTWSAIAASEANAWHGVAYGNSVFIAISSDGTNRTMRSLDYGATWTSVGISHTDSPRSIAYNTDLERWAIIGDTGRVYYSDDDGVTWSSVVSLSTAEWRGLTYGAGVFVAVSYANTAISPDGIVWQTLTNSVTVTDQRVAYGGGVFVVSSSASNFLRSVPV